MSEQTFDIAVLGAGPGGYVAAIRAADLGASVALIEPGHSGGTCLNVGCIPTKSMLHSSDLYYQTATVGPAMGIHADNLRFELAEQIDAKDKIVTRLRNGLDKVIGQRKNITRFSAFGRFAGADRDDSGAPMKFHIALFKPADRQSEIGRVAAGKVIIATGSRPIRPRGMVFDSTHIVTTDEILSIRKQPGRLLVLGGGVNGCEQATFYAQIGTAITIVEALDRILPALDEEFSREIAKSLKKRQATIVTGKRAAGIELKGDAVVTTLDDGSVLETDMALVAIGRNPNSDDIGLEKIGLDISPARFVNVDDRCRTAVPNVFAVGDVTGVAAYAHTAFRQGEVAAANACGRDESDDMTIIPTGIFTHPEIGTVGITEREAVARELNVRIARFPLQALGIAQAQHMPTGSVKLVVDAHSGKVLGAAAVCSRGVEIVHEVAVAMRHGLDVDDLAHTIHAHPTYSEAIKEVADHYLGLPIHGLKS